MTYRIARTVPVALASLALALGGYSAYTAHTDARADITVLPCSAYEDGAHPVIPTHTFTGGCALEDGTLSTPGALPSIPRCTHDDWNDGTQARCWTETVEGAVLVIDATDTVVSQHAE
jgi:hypothetical protein